MSTTTVDEVDPAAYVDALDARSRRVETPCGDGTMVWRVWGEGNGHKPVVLGHGAQGAWSHWIRNIDALAERRMVIAADLPGHGDSALPAAQDAPAICEALAVGLGQIVPGDLPVDFLGFSLSGVIFSYLAALHPGIARRVILIGCGGLGTPHGPIRIGRVGGLKGDERKAALKANLLGLMLSSPDAADDLAIHLLERNARLTRLTVAPDLVIPDRLAKVLPQVNVPVDAIWGANDLPHPDPALQEAVIRRSHPQTDFRVVADAGHWAMYEQPEAFNAVLLDMLG